MSDPAFEQFVSDISLWWVGETPDMPMRVSARVDKLRAVYKRIAELETENAALRAQVKESSCWHCGDVLEPEPPPRCERCPAFGQCDDGACPEPGCAHEVNND